MSFQAYIDAVKAKTGKSPDDFRALAEEKGLTGPTVKAGDVVSWLKKDFGLGHGHAMAIYSLLKADHTPRGSADERIDKAFAGGKAAWRGAFDSLTESARSFGDDVDLAPTSSYISLVRAGRKFAIVQPSASAMDVGFKRKGVPATERFTDSGAWNAMVTHRLRVTDPGQVDAEVVEWLKAAYDAAAKS
jgi:hypothetical protein